MASDETMTLLSSSQDDDYDGTDDGSDHLDRPHNFSRLCICSRSINGECDDGNGDDGSQMEGFDADAEVEFSDGNDGGKGLPDQSSDSERMEPPTGWFSSLPATPGRWRARGCASMGLEVKDYGSENDVGKRGTMRRRKTVRSRRASGGGSFSGESEGGGGGVVVITRPKGGRRSLCMDLEEMKACRDLGFELEHQRMVELPSSGADSPIASWRVASPGDDPRDVKARLKAWAQAVALASAARQRSF